MMNTPHDDPSNPDIDRFFQWRDVEEEYGGRSDRYTEMRAKLACGCWSDWVSNASSTWDFPSEEHMCEVHGERQLHLTVQALLNDPHSIMWGES